jgi:ribonuclease HII
LQTTPHRLSPAAAKLRLLKSLRCTIRYEKEAWRKGSRLVGGVDEVGRGCLFGPVVAAAVILNPQDRIRGLRDSKLLPEQTRERLAAQIRARAFCWAFAAVDAAEIDAINILQASRLAMRNAVLQLHPEPDFLLVDAVCLDHPCTQRAIIHGDALSVSIAAASIIAKVERDRMMRELDATYPQYALASNKGYGTRAHRAALLEHGPTPLHRMTFAPVRSTQEEFAFSDDADDLIGDDLLGDDLLGDDLREADLREADLREADLPKDGLPEDFDPGYTA